MSEAKMQEQTGRIVAAARSRAWWDDAQLAERARQWLDGTADAGSIGRRHWQALVEAGLGAGDFEGLLRELKTLMNGSGHRKGIARRWKREGLADELLAAVSNAAKDDTDAAAGDLRSLMDQIPNEEESAGAVRGRAEDVRRIGRGRSFLRFLRVHAVCREQAEGLE